MKQIQNQKFQTDGGEIFIHRRVWENAAQTPPIFLDYVSSEMTDINQYN